MKTLKSSNNLDKTEHDVSQSRNGPRLQLTRKSSFLQPFLTHQINASKPLCLATCNRPFFCNTTLLAIPAMILKLSQITSIIAHANANSLPEPAVLISFTRPNKIHFPAPFSQSAGC